MSPLESDIYHRLELVALQVDDLLGDDLIDRTLLHDRLTSRARQYAAQLVADNPKLAAQTAIDLAQLVDLDDVTDAASPLGIACALTFDSPEVTPTDAAQLLNITRSRVYQLLDTGKLERGAGGGVTRASVARRLARFSSTT